MPCNFLFFFVGVWGVVEGGVGGGVRSVTVGVQFQSAPVAPSEGGVNPNNLSETIKN